MDRITAIAILAPAEQVASQVPVEPKVVAANTGREALDATAQIDLFDSQMHAVYTYFFLGTHLTAGEYDTLTADPWTPGDTGETYTVRFWVNSDADQSSFSDTIFKQVRVTEGGIVEFAEQLSFTLYVNPLKNRSLRLEISVPYRTKVNITIYDAGGHRIAILTDTPFQPGTHTLTWDGCDDKGHKVAQGVYLVRMEADGWSDVKKVIIVN